MSNNLKIGTKVKYYPFLNNKNLFTEHEVTSEPWDICGETVVKLSNKRGGVSVEHLEVI